MNLLEHPLVREYFSCPSLHGTIRMCEDKRCIALNVLHAMQQPIKNGEQYLALNRDCHTVEGPIYHDNDTDLTRQWHLPFLRLPDRFQQRDEVEEKINALLKLWQVPSRSYVKDGLYELVELVRKESK